MCIYDVSGNLSVIAHTLSARAGDGTALGLSDAAASIAVGHCITQMIRAHVSFGTRERHWGARGNDGIVPGFVPR